MFRLLVYTYSGPAVKDCAYVESAASYVENAAALNALQGQITSATTKTLKEANDLVKAAKAQELPLTIHPSP